MSFPSNPGALTASWLTEILRASGALRQGHVTAFDCQLLGGTRGAMSLLGRLSLTYAGGDGPPTLICKFSKPDPEARAAAWALYESELLFYDQLASQVEMRVPRCYHSAARPETYEFALLLEDLAPARNGERIAGCSMTELELAIQAIAALHAAWWEHPALDEMPWLSHLYTPGGLATVQGIYQACWSGFVQRMGAELSGTLLSISERFLPSVADVYRRFYEPPRTLVHGDYQLDNFFFGGPLGPNGLAVIDWQFVFAGRGAFDLASLIASSLEPADRRRCERDLLATYHRLLVEGGVRGYAFEDLWDDYRLSMFDGLLRMAMSIGLSAMREGQDRAHREVIWPRFAAALLDLEVGELLP